LKNTPEIDPTYDPFKIYKYTRLPAPIMNSDLNAIEKLIYEYIATIAVMNKNSASLKIDTLVDIFKIKRRQVHDHIKKLKDKRLIGSKRNGRGSTYWLLPIERADGIVVCESSKQNRCLQEDNQICGIPFIIDSFNWPDVWKTAYQMCGKLHITDQINQEMCGKLHIRCAENCISDVRKTAHHISIKSSLKTLLKERTHAPLFSFSAQVQDLVSKISPEHLEAAADDRSFLGALQDYATRKGTENADQMIAYANVEAAAGKIRNGSYVGLLVGIMASPGGFKPRKRANNFHSECNSTGIGAPSRDDQANGNGPVRIGDILCRQQDEIERKRKAEVESSNLEMEAAAEKFKALPECEKEEIIRGYESSPSAYTPMRYRRATLDGKADMMGVRSYLIGVFNNNNKQEAVR